MSHHQQQQEYQDHILASLAQQNQVPVYETPEMLSEMFSFGHGPGQGPASEILDYRRAVGGLGSDWYGSSRQINIRDNIGDHHHHHHHPQHGDHTPTSHNHHHNHEMHNMTVDSTSSMQLFLTNPTQRSPSPPQQPPQHDGGGSTLHMLLPRPSSNMEPSGYSTGPNPSYWSSETSHVNNMVEGQGLSLSLSSSLQHLEASKQAQDNNNQLMFFNIMQQHNLQGVGPSPGSGSSSSGQQQVQVGFGLGSSLGVVNGLKCSKYVKAAQELLDEFCSVGRGYLKKNKLTRQDSVNPSSTGPGDGSPSKDPSQLSPSERVEHQRRKVKLLSMLDEVDRRYNRYCEQMQMVVNSFDLVMGYGAATPYTVLAQKAMSRHFRCLKDAIHTQFKRSCDALGEKDPTAQTGLTKGETPRLKMLEQSLRQQRAFQHHQMGMTMEQEAWRPQRGLPERSVNILRSWLFEHFLHPYPSDADKHTLARQTGLSRNQVSNWFINARVRLWKPMVEEMYQQEAKELEEDELDSEDDQDNNKDIIHQTTNTSFPTTQPPPPPPAAHPLLDDVDPTTMIRFGPTTGDVSLTLGLQHAGNTPEKNPSFSLRDFPS